MKIVVLIQARQDSTRFPGKIFAEIDNKPIYKWMRDSVINCNLIDDYYFIIPTTNNEQLYKTLVENNIKVEMCTKGKNVLLGFKKMKEKLEMANDDGFVRITADCPLVNTKMIDYLIELYREYPFSFYGYDIPDKCPDGLDIEVFPAKFIELAYCNNLKRLKSESYCREHVTPWIKRNCKVQLIDAGLSYLKDVKLSIDSAEDLSRVQLLTRGLLTRGISNIWEWR